MDDAALTLVILGAVIVLFVWNRLPVGVVAILTMLALWGTGLLPTEAVLAGFGDPVVVLHRDALRRQRGHRLDRGHHLAGPAHRRQGR